MAKLSETALIILAAAAARDNHHILPLPSLKAPSVAVQKTLNGLLAAGLVEEIPAHRGDEVRKQSEDGGRIALMIARAGLVAIGIQPEATSKPTPKAKPAKKTATRARRRPTAAKSGKPRVKAAKTPAPAPKGLSKQNIVVGMLRRATGASIAELADATDWQAHSVRGVLTATIKGRLGLPLISEKGEDGVRRYFVAPIRTSKTEAQS